MKRIIALLVIVAALCMAGAAQADKVYITNCNNNPGHYVLADGVTFSGIDHGAGDGSVVLHWTQYCGSGPQSVEAEVQYSSTSGGTYNDVLSENFDSQDFSFNTPTSMDNVLQSRTSTQGLVVCDHGWFRMKVYYNGGSDVGTPVAGPC